MEKAFDSAMKFTGLRRGCSGLCISLGFEQSKTKDESNVNVFERCILEWVL